MLTVEAPEPATVDRVTGHVVLITELYPPAIGGSAVLFQEVYRRLGGRLSVITEARPEPPALNGALVTHAVSTPDWGVLRPAAIRHHWRTARVLRRVARDPNAVVHCGRALPEGIAAWINHLVARTPYVCWAHGEDLGTASTSRELTFATTRVYRGAACAIANSRNTAAMLGKFGISSDRISIAYPGVDSERFSPQVDAGPIRRRYAPDGEVLLLSVGRLQRRKGHDIAIRTLARLRGFFQLKYLIAGDGEERPRLEQLARECGVADLVVFLGAVSDVDLPLYYGASDIFLLPNRIDDGDIEGFGIVFLEAASSGRAVIGGNTGGVPEAVADGETGLLVSGTDVEELAVTIRRLVADPSLRARLGGAGRLRVLQSFTWERAAATVRSIHERALTSVG